MFLAWTKRNSAHSSQRCSVRWSASRNQHVSHSCHRRCVYTTTWGVVAEAQREVVWSGQTRFRRYRSGTLNRSSRSRCGTRRGWNVCESKNEDVETSVSSSEVQGLYEFSGRDAWREGWCATRRSAGQPCGPYQRTWQASSARFRQELSCRWIGKSREDGVLRS